MARLISRLCGGPRIQQPARRHDLLTRQVGPLRSQAEQIIKVRVRPEILPVPGGIGPVDMHERGIEPQGRHGHQLLAVVIRRPDHPQLRIDPQDIGPQPRPHGEERQPVRRREKPPVHHPLINLGQLDPPLLPPDPEMRLQRDRVERHKPADNPPHPPERNKQPHIRPAIRDHGQVVQPGPQNGPHKGHRLAPRPPPPDPDRHPRPQLPGHLIRAHQPAGGAGVTGEVCGAGGTGRPGQGGGMLVTASRPRRPGGPCHPPQ